jgi:uncharacterized membrane protein YbaN (DUF454 family)
MRLMMFHFFDLFSIGVIGIFLRVFPDVLFDSFLQSCLSFLRSISS